MAELAGQEMYRQGDLLFVRQETLPLAETLKARTSQIILEGETTGHAHRLQAGTVLDAPETGMIWLDVPHPTQVVHEEHYSITLDAGPWLVIRQREYSPEAIRLVVD